MIRASRNSVRIDAQSARTAAPDLCYLQSMLDPRPGRAADRRLRPRSSLENELVMTSE
jgi:hypothetical protein